MSQHRADVPTASPLMDRRDLFIDGFTDAGQASRVDALPLPVSEKPYAGWVERVGYQMMDHVLKTGWTPERATSFYGGISESKMRSMVAHARRQRFLK
jgi:hypothetical protein